MYGMDEVPEEIESYIEAAAAEPAMEASAMFESMIDVMFADEFVRNRIRMQQQYMSEIWERFDGQVRPLLPQFESDIRGVAMLRRSAEALFAGAGESAPSRAFSFQPDKTLRRFAEGTQWAQ